MVSTASFRKLAAALAAFPDDSRLLHDYCYAGEEHFAEEVLDTLRQRLAGRGLYEAIRLNELALYAYMCERTLRRASGLAPCNARDLDDIDYLFARAELSALIEAARVFLQRYPSSYGAGVLLADALVSLGSIGEAEAIYASLRQARGPGTAAVTSFDPDFHASLRSGADNNFRVLPPVEPVISLEPAITEAIFISSDHAYFQRYGWALVESFHRHQSPTALALHVMDATTDEALALKEKLTAFAGLRFALSTEWTGHRAEQPSEDARGYYHAIRFVRFWQFIEKHTAAVWMLDADLIFNRSPRSLFDLLRGSDLGLNLFPGRLETRNKVAAGYVGVAPTEPGADYLLRVAAYIAAFQNRGSLPWGIDQVALYAVLRQSASLKIASLPPAIADGSVETDRALWPGK